jgi:hypothetical protein
MTGLQCNARARRASGLFATLWPIVTAVTGNSAQGFARSALRFLALLGVMLLAGCASSASSSLASSPASLSSAGAVDAVLPVGDGFRVFQLGTLRHAKIAGSPEAWAGGTPAVTPTSPVLSSSDSSSVAIPTSSWLKLAAPAGAFRPVQAVWAQRGYFLLLDAASARLCLYDEGAALLSTFPLPEAFTPFSTGRTAVFRGADGAFTFVDYAAGEGWQFADRQTSGAGTTQWVSRGRVKLPAGLRSCMQPPGSEELFCRGADGAPLRFDGALNRVPAHRAAASEASDVRGGIPGPFMAAKWNGEAREWILEGRADSGSKLFRFLPAQRRWLPLSAPPEAP